MTNERLRPRRFGENTNETSEQVKRANKIINRIIIISKRQSIDGVTGHFFFLQFLGAVG